MRRLVWSIMLGVLLATGMPGQVAAPAVGAKAVPVPAHEANFDAERKQANELFLGGKTLEALPLYEDLCRQDQTIAVFAERHAVGLFGKEPTVAPAERARVHEQAVGELRRAQSLGDNSPLVQNMLSIEGKGVIGSILSGVAMTVGYTYHGNQAAQGPMAAAEAAFSRREYAAALPLYERAIAADPAWYEPPLTLGDTYFSMGNWAQAGVWFGRAIAIDPDRDTAYRYWGDALLKSGDREGAKRKLEEAVVAEPYSPPGWNSLQQWVSATKSTLRPWPEIVRPEWTMTADGKLQVDSALMAEDGTGQASWLIYEQRRVAHGAPALTQWVVAGGTDRNGQLTPSGYRHSLAEETDALDAMLLDVQVKLAGGAVTAERLEPSLKALLDLKRDGWLECWIALRGADAGIRFDYPAFRKAHRDLLVRYVDSRVVPGP